MKATAQLRHEGRVTIPASVREQLALDHGDFVILEITPVAEESNTETIEQEPRGDTP